jgi:hypothetical protein
LRSEERPLLLRLAIRLRLELALGALVVLLFADYLFSEQLLYGSDSIPAGLFFRGLLVDFVKEFGELPRWNPYILGGLPFLDATHGDTFFPSSALHFLMPVYRALGHKLLLHLFLAGAFMAYYLRALALRPGAVAIGSLSYMLSPVFVSYLFAGQDGKMYVTSLAPLVLGTLERAMWAGGLRTFLGLGVTIGVTILSAQIQMAYHLMWFAGALWLVRVFRGPAGGGEAPPRARTIGLFGAAVAVGLLVAAIQLVPAVAYVKHPAGFSVRSAKTDYEHATSWCLHPEEIASMVVPDFCDAPHRYWGRNPFKYNSDYVGILTLLLAVLALVRRRDATRLFLGGIALLAILYSLGQWTPLHRLFYLVVPQVKLFRAPPLVMFAAAFGLSALAACAVHDLEEAAGGGGKRREPTGMRNLLTAGLAVAGGIALCGLAASGVTSFWNDLFYPEITDPQRRLQAAGLPGFRNGALVVAGVLAAGTALVNARARGTLPAKPFLGALALFFVVDLWRVDKDFKVVMEPDRFIVPDALLAPIAQESRREKFRVMPVARQYQFNELGYFGIESVMGFHDNELAWYRELRESPEVLQPVRGEYPFLQMLNVKYVLHDMPDVPNPLPVANFRPRFWLAGSWEVVEDRAAIPARLVDEGFDVSTTVLLEEDPGIAPAEGPAGAIRSYEYDGNRIRIDVEAERDCLLVHVENWFPYWRAYEGDRELPMLRANGAIRAVPLAAGKHALELRFRSAPYEMGKTITLATLLGVAAAAISLRIRRARVAA